MKPTDLAERAGRRRRRLGGFGRDAEGTAAVEFALSVPLLIGLAFSVAGLGLGATAYRKVALLAFTIGDLVAQESQTGTADTQDVFQAANVILPASMRASLAQRLMSVKPVLANQVVTAAYVDWCAQSGSAPNFSCPANGTVLVGFPLALLPTATSSIIKSDVRDTFSNPVPGFLPEGLNLSGTNYLTPRVSASVAWTQ